MTDAIHLKLDKILARQEDHATQLHDLNLGQAALVAGLEHMSSDLLTQRELLLRLEEALTAEDESTDFAELLSRIEQTLTTLVAGNVEMIAALGELPDMLSDRIDSARDQPGPHQGH